MPRTSRRRPVRTKSRSRRYERNAGPAAQWTRNFGFPTSWTTRIGDDELSITLEATRPMQAAVARVEINGKLAGRYDSLREAKEAAEAEAAAVPSEIVPAYDVDAPATMGAALLAGRSDVLVSQETIDYDEKWSPYQRAVFDFVRRGKGNAIVEAVAGSGKAQPNSAMVRTPSGEVRIGDVHVGDAVLGRGGERKTVNGVFPQGVKSVFRLTLANGAVTECTDDHLWLVASDDAQDGKVRRFADVMQNPSAYRVPMASGEWSEIRSIEAVGEKECRCISVGGDGLYVTDGGIVTHNTTTLMQALEYIPRDASVLILAFNSSIQLELQSRAPRNRHVTIKTLTGWGLSFLRRHWKTPMASQSEGNRRDDAVVEESIPSFRESGLPFQDDEDGNMGYDTLKRSASTLIGLCMSYMAVSDASITEVQRDFDLFVDDNGDPEGFVLYGPMGPDHSEANPAKWTHRDVLSWVKTAISLQLKEPKDGGSISFRDMVFVPAMHPGWKAPELYDFVFVDETQDCDVAQLSLVMRAVKPRGRIIVIGDRNQCVAVDTMVTTPTGEVRADALSVGDPITVYLNGKNAEQTVQTLSPVREADCVRVRTASGRSLTMSLEHRIWSTPPTLRDPGHMLVYLMYRSDLGFRVGVTNRGYHQKKNCNTFGNRLNSESASRLWVLDEASSREEALQRETEYSLAYGVPTLVFNAEERGINQTRVNAIFAKFGSRGREILKDKGYNFDYPHWMKRTASTANVSRQVVTLISQGPKGSTVSVEGALDAELLRAHGHSVTPRKQSGWRVRKFFARNCDAEQYADRLSSLIGASLVSRLHVHGREGLQLTNAASLLVGMEIAVKDGDAVRVEAIESIDRCRASVIDIGAGTANNFYGNGILSHNSIYRFRGADTDAMPRLERELNATRLPLSVSYRVTQCAADEARKLVGDFDVPRNANGEPMATPGICNEISARKMAALWDAGDVVITRSTKIKGEPGLLSKIALKVFVTGKIPYVMGDPDALPKVLRGAIKQITKYMKLGVDTIDAFRDATDEWVAQGQERFRLELIATRERQEKVLKRRYRGHRLDDGVEDFEEWKRFDEIRSCFFNSDGTGIAQQEGVSDLGSIETRIKQLSPTDDDLEKMTPERFKRIVAQCVTISTTHKIKGAEFPRVFVLESTFGYTRTGLQPRRKQKPKAAIEEKNLWYVAITRVKGERGNIERGIMPREGELYYVNDIESLVRGKTVKDLQEVMK